MNGATIVQHVSVTVINYFRDIIVTGDSFIREY